MLGLMDSCWVAPPVTRRIGGHRGNETTMTQRKGDDINNPPDQDPQNSAKLHRPTIIRATDPVFSEDEHGIKHLEEHCGHTATTVYWKLPILSDQARHAMETIQQQRQYKVTISPDALRAYPAIVEWGNRKDREELVASEPGFPEPKKWAVQVMADRLQLSPATILKYARTPPDETVASEATEQDTQTLRFS